MLLSPRLVQLAEVPDKGSSTRGNNTPFIRWSHSRREVVTAHRHFKNMLLVHQSGSVRVGEILRYTLTYTPADDRILPSPPALYVKIKNHRAIPLRAAYLRGPYNIYCAAYPSTFDPNHKEDDQSQYGTPQFEPYLKPGGEWIAKLTVPDDVRETAETFARGYQQQGEKKSVTWIIEVVSQIIFSLSASVNFELLVSRDEHSLELGKIAVASQHAIQAGEQGPDANATKSAVDVKSTRGIYSKAVKLVVEDTASLWDRPALPEWEGRPPSRRRQSRASIRRSMSFRVEPPKVTKQKKIHLVVLTHGIHSNVAADMLYMKESIDATVKKAREKGRQRKKSAGKEQEPSSPGAPPDTSHSNTIDFASTPKPVDEPTDNGFWEDNEDDSSDEEAKKLKPILSREEIVSEPEEVDASTAPLSGGQDELDEDATDDEDDEEIVVRGFSGNVTHTERGIQYLGKRMAKSILEMTYPDQPYKPMKKSASQKLASTFSSQSSKLSQDEASAAHAHSSIYKPDENLPKRAYKYTSISFVGHSLGGLVQLYAIGYIQKHSPEFFDYIKPVNFVAMASPFLGLSNENPVYVKFALDFGLVGRTGQDLGLTWRPPTLAKGLWDVVFQSNDKKKTEQPDPGAKPLLRILPSGPAHQVLKRFKRRTVYSNIVNDGIVPLRTGCLLFLDWRGLEKVDKARRENGVIGTMANWGWQEMTGQNSSPHPYKETANEDEDDDDAGTPPKTAGTERSRFGSEVPQPAEDTTNADDEAQTEAQIQGRSSFEESAQRQVEKQDKPSQASGDVTKRNASPGPFDTFLNFFRYSGPASKAENLKVPTLKPPKPHPKLSKKDSRVFKRGQTLKPGEFDGESSQDGSTRPSSEHHIPNREEGERGMQAHVDHPTRPKASRGDSVLEDPSAPPKTSFFESAGDLLAPPIPTGKWINEPESRSKVIFHDRVYRPEDIPPPPTRKGTRSGRSISSGDYVPSSSLEAYTGTVMLSDSMMSGASMNSDGVEVASMRVEEKIARAYHHELTWRKVLVKLEPDAHNNMVVRRMFSNAYGWPVIKHLCENHFTD